MGECNGVFYANWQTRWITTSDNDPNFLTLVKTRFIVLVITKPSLLPGGVGLIFVF